MQTRCRRNRCQSDRSGKFTEETSRRRCTVGWVVQMDGGGGYAQFWWYERVLLEPGEWGSMHHCH